MIQQLLDDHQLFHSEFQQDQIITTKTGGTIYGQYKQALRELYKRIRGYREDIHNRDMLLVDIEELEHQLENENIDRFEQKRKEIDLRTKLARLEESERVCRKTAREGARFYQQAVALKELVGELTPKKRAQMDREMWLYRIKYWAYRDYVTQGHLGAHAFEFAMAVEGKEGEELRKLIGDRKAVETEVNRQNRIQNKLLSNKLLKLPAPSEETFLQLMEVNHAGTKEI